MKIYSKIKSISLFCSMFFILNSCGSDDNNSITQEALVALVQNTIANGSWDVSLFSENGTNKTEDFNGYTFVFTPSNAIVVTQNSDTFPGLWSLGVDSGKAKFILNFFATNGPLEEISEDWQIIDASTNRIQLSHVSGGNGTTDLLTFQRNQN